MAIKRTINEHCQLCGKQQIRRHGAKVIWYTSCNCACIPGPPNPPKQFRIDEVIINWSEISTDVAVAEPAQEKQECGLTFDDAIAIAKGCFDYGGGHRSDGTLGVFHHGIQTVVNALEAAKNRGLADSQVAVLHRLGNLENANHQ